MRRKYLNLMLNNKQIQKEVFPQEIKKGVQITFQSLTVYKIFEKLKLNIEKIVNHFQKKTLKNNMQIITCDTIQNCRYFINKNY